MRCFLFNIDMTLRDTRHRNYILNRNQERTNKDWEDFNSLAYKDPVIEPMKDIYTSLELHHLYLMTGMDESCRDQTVNWLSENGLKNYRLLLMRPTGDKTPSWELKKSFICRLKIAGYNRITVFDNLLIDCEQMRLMGVTVLRSSELTQYI